MSKINNFDCLEIMENLYDGIYVSDENGVTLFVNNSYCKMTGIAKNEIIGRSVEDIEREGKLYRGSVTTQVLKEKRVISSIGKSLITGKDLLITGTPIFDKDKNIKLVVVNDRDISDLKKLEDDNKNLKKIQEKFDKQVDYFNENQILNKNMEISELPANIYNILKEVAPSNLSILIIGEYGTGKDNLAQKIYQYSSRNDYPFFSISAKEYSELEFNKKLFGENDTKEQFSLIELANKGTLYISDIDSLSEKLQKKLLKILDTKKNKNLKNDKVDVDIRFIFSSNINLKLKVEKRAFLSELYEKLSIISLKIPSLRERKEDITKLAEKFLLNFNKKYSKKIILCKDDFKLLKLYDWPGNIKELENFIERLVISSNKDTNINESMKSMLLLKHSDIFPQQNLTLKEMMKEIEKNIIIKVLNQYGSINKAASILGMSQPALSKKCKVLNILK